uniref:F-box domain-containing protein n=1 Tax=Caenorhabditis tropicalis TaxID=1561998 RepID=A0A1I7TVK1_9PELO
MFVDSLLKLSSKAVAKGLKEGFYKHHNVSLEPPLSDKVFDEVVMITADCSPVLAKETGLKLNLTNFYSNWFIVTHTDMKNLHSHDIRSVALNLNEFSKVPEFIIETDEGEDQLDIFLVLKTCLNENSLQNLKHLDLYYSGDLPDDWVQLIGSLLPNLQSFKCQTVSKEEFELICRSFPNLTRLEINYANSDTLNDTFNLKNLQVFEMIHSTFVSSENLEKLFEIPNLRVLDVSWSEGFFENLLLCDGTFQNLKFIECGGSNITQTQLRDLVARHPSLESIAILETPCDLVDFSDVGIKVMNLGTIESTMHTLHYSLYQHNGYRLSDQTRRCIDRIKTFLEDETIPEGFREDEFLELMMKAYRSYDFNVIDCLVLFIKHMFPGQPIDDVIQNEQSKTPLFVKRRWAAQVVSTYNALFKL